MIHLMSSHQALWRARRLLDELLADFAAGRPEAEIIARFAATPQGDLLRARKLIDQHLTPNAPPLPIEVVQNGLPFREWLADQLDLDYPRVRRLLTFIDEYGAWAANHGRVPTIPEFAADTEQSVATINRRLSEFRSVFPAERDPLRLARVLRQGLDDLSLWRSIDESLEATIGDVPVVLNHRGSGSPRSPTHPSMRSR